MNPMSSPEPILFHQIVSETHQIMRLHLQLAQGDQSVLPHIDELTQALAVKRAILEGIAPSEDGLPPQSPIDPLRFGTKQNGS